MQKTYDAVLGISIFPDQLCCLTYTLVQARLKYAFFVNESLSDYPSFTNSLQATIDACLMKTTALVSVSQTLQEAMRDARPAVSTLPYLILPPLLDPAFEIARASLSTTPSPRHGRPIVITVSRLVPSKKILACVSLHHQLKQSGVDFEWWIIGDGPEFTAIQDAVKACDLVDDFKLLGEQTDVASYLMQADVFALFSESEGCPTVILEALYMGCPVISTRVHGVDRYVRHRINGLLVGQDTPSQIAGLKELLQQPDLRASMCAALQSEPVAINQGVEELITHLHNALSGANTNLPLVTILIPTYNQADYLDQAIGSALMQDYPHLEVIVLDDASSDETPAICASWAHDVRLRCHRNAHNIGRVANYRQGLYDQAQGDWVVMLDGDDFYTDPHFISDAIAALRNFESEAPVFVQAGHTSTYMNGEHSDTDIIPDIDGSFALLDSGRYLQLIFKTGFFTHLGILFNRVRAIKQQVYALDISSSEMDSFMRLALDGKVLLMRRSVGKWRQHDRNTSSHLRLDDLAPNLKIFRTVAHTAVQRLLVHQSELEPYLSKYEAQTFAYLYSRCLLHQDDAEKSLKTLRKIIYIINPRLFFNKTILRLIIRQFIQQCRHAVKGWL